MSETNKQDEQLSAEKILKDFTTNFFFYWYNKSGSNTYQGYDEFIKEPKYKEHFDILINSIKSTEDKKRIAELEKELSDVKSKADAKWIDVSIEPEYGGEYNVLYDLEDGETELIVTTLMYCKLEKTWRDERGANYIVNTVKKWQYLPEAIQLPK